MFAVITNHGLSPGSANRQHFIGACCLCNGEEGKRYFRFSSGQMMIHTRKQSPPSRSYAMPTFVHVRPPPHLLRDR